MFALSLVISIIIFIISSFVGLTTSLYWYYTDRDSFTTDVFSDCVLFGFITPLLSFVLLMLWFIILPLVLFFGLFVLISRYVAKKLSKYEIYIRKINKETE